MRRLSALLLAVLGLAVAAPALGETRGVLVKDNSFAPKTLQAAAGDSVRFKWSSTENPHDVKFTKVPQGASKPRTCSLKTSGKCKRKVARAGVYKYVCTIHLASDNMRGKIVVD
jgi:plastocyanin